MPKRTLLITLLITILTGGIAAASLYLGKKLSQPQEGLPEFSSSEPEEIAPEITPTEPSEIDTSDWKTHTDKEYGFEVKYPKSYKLTDRVGGVSFGYKYDLDIIPNSEGLTLLEYINRNIIQTDDPRIGKTILKKSISIAGTDVVRFEGEIFGSEEGPWRYGIDVFWLKNKKIYRFSYSPGVIKEKINTVEVAIFDQMLSTFKFIK